MPAYQEFTGTIPGNEVLTCRGGYDSWGDNDRSPPAGGPYIEWTENFERMGTGAFLSCAGFGGNTIQSIAGVWSPLTVAGAPDATLSLLLAGLNNILLTNDDDTTIIGAYRAWMADVQTPKHVICTIPPPYNLDPNREAVRKSVNRLLTEGELGPTAYIVNLEPLLLNTTDPYEWKPEYLDDQAESPHPNEVCCAAIWDEMYLSIVASQLTVVEDWVKVPLSNDSWTRVGAI